MLRVSSIEYGVEFRKPWLNSTFSLTLCIDSLSVPHTDGQTNLSKNVLKILPQVEMKSHLLPLQLDLRNCGHLVLKVNTNRGLGENILLNGQTIVYKIELNIYFNYGSRVNRRITYVCIFKTRHIFCDIC